NSVKFKQFQKSKHKVNLMLQSTFFRIFDLKMKSPVLFFSLFTLLFLSFTVLNGQSPAATPKKDDPLKNFQYRLIGPFRGGRVGAVAGVSSQPNVYYFGATGGGVWKSTDSGTSWENISDGFFKTGSVGAIAVADSDPNVIYVGMGEETIRG